MKEIDVSEYSDIPFVEKGRSRNGSDCWGIPYLIYRDRLNINLPTYIEQYHDTENEKELSALIDEEKLLWKEVVYPEMYDVIVLRLKGRPMHVGVYIGNGKFIHCMSGSGTTVEKIASTTWRNRIIGFYRYSK